MVKPKLDPFMIYDATAQEQAFEKVRELIAAVPEAEISRPRVDIHRVVGSVRNVVQLFAERPDLVERLRTLPAREFDQSHLDRLGTVNAALGYTHRQHILSAGEEGGVSPELRQKAEQLEKRMQSVLEYNLMGDPEVKPKLVALAEGHGYRDLINDLFGYAELYEQYFDVLKRDGNKVDAADGPRARELASKMDAVLVTLDGRQWHEMRDRAYSLLVQSYEQVAAAALWLLRHEPRTAAHFTSLHVKGRKRRTTAARTKGAQDTPAPDGPVAGAEGEDDPE